jgi:hypothetical protein
MENARRLFLVFCQGVAPSSLQTNATGIRLQKNGGWVPPVTAGHGETELFVLFVGKSPPSLRSRVPIRTSGILGGLPASIPRDTRYCDLLMTHAFESTNARRPQAQQSRFKWCVHSGHLRIIPRLRRWRTEQPQIPLKRLTYSRAAEKNRGHGSCPRNSRAATAGAPKRLIED